MNEGRPKRVKTTTGINHPLRHPGRQRNLDSGGSSSTQGGKIHLRNDSHYTRTLQAERLVKFIGRKKTYIRYANMAWMMKQDFQFPLKLEAQWANTFMEFPSLVRKFYRNFQYKDGKYVTVVKGKFITLDEELFLEVGGLARDCSPLGDWNNEMWNSYDSTEMYKSCIRGPHYYVQGELTKAGSMTFENRLLHYRIVYVLVQQNINHAQPTGNDLKLIFDALQASATFKIKCKSERQQIFKLNLNLKASGLFLRRLQDLQDWFVIIKKREIVNASMQGYDFDEDKA
ncbi:hypothetical protein Lal_00016642 [Lupinus albus]|nr:hypothetical protein Lal_00016642 [Lupinus albus]